MIEAMEQQMINSINGRWTKDKSKRKEIDIHIFNYYYHFFTNNRYSDRYSLGV